MSSTRSRIAPTPSGFLHIGNLYSFVLTWLITRKQNGQLLLRIDDMDGERKREEYLEDIFETLDFLGVDYDEGPANSDDFQQHYSQALRMEQYNNLLDQLAETGLVYGCTCSRKELAGLAADGKSFCPCRYKKNKLEKASVSWRIIVAQKTIISWKDGFQNNVELDLSKTMGDFVVRRKDSLPAYQVTSLADDIFYRINCIVRGEDLLASTAAQLYLAQLTGNDLFTKAHFFHHPLVKDRNDNKLSKSAGATAIKVMRQNGMTAAEIINTIRLLPAIAVENEVGTLRELLNAFKKRNPEKYQIS